MKPASCIFKIKQSLNRKLKFIVLWNFYFYYHINLHCDNDTHLKILVHHLLMYTAFSSKSTNYKAYRFLNIKIYISTLFFIFIAHWK